MKRFLIWAVVIVVIMAIVLFGYGMLRFLFSGHTPWSRASDGALAGRTAGQIAASATQAAGAASSLRVVGERPESPGVTAFDLAIARTGKVSGTITFGRSQVSVRRIGATIYLRGDDAFWAGNEYGVTNTERVTGHWARMKQSDQRFAKLFELTTAQGTGGVFALTPELRRYLTLTDQTVVNGKTVIGAKQVLPGSEGTLYVANDTPPFPVLMTGPGHERTDYSGWNKPVKVNAPAAFVTL